jgi:type II secretory pathway pseudopilin PulG
MNMEVRNWMIAAGLLAGLAYGAMPTWAAPDRQVATNKQATAAIATAETNIAKAVTNAFDQLRADLNAAPAGDDKNNAQKDDNVKNALKNFGIGIGAVFGGPGGGAVSDANIGADKKVHVTKQQQAEARIIFEYHMWLATENENSMLIQAVRALCSPCKDCLDDCFEGWHAPTNGVIAGGLQVVVLTDPANTAINGFGGGYIMGIRNADKRDKSWNIGIGAVLQNSYKQLGSGFADGQPAPAGATTVQYKDTSVIRGYIMASFSW